MTKKDWKEEIKKKRKKELEYLLNIYAMGINENVNAFSRYIASKKSLIFIISNKYTIMPSFLSLIKYVVLYYHY